MEGQAKSAAYLTSIALKSAGRHPWHQVGLWWIHMSGILVVTMSMSSTCSPSVGRFSGSTQGGSSLLR